MISLKGGKYKLKRIHEAMKLTKKYPEKPKTAESKQEKTKATSD
jgi:hypothetical protein